jgi:hypothetical protein
LRPFSIGCEAKASLNHKGRKFKISDVLRLTGLGIVTGYVKDLTNKNLEM